MLDRRTFLRAASGTLAGTAALGLGGCRSRPRWHPAAYRKTERSSVAVFGAERYEGSLSDLIERGIRLLGVPVAGRRILLKPNLVEYDPGGVINTHPVLVAAAVEAFRSLGAARVLVGEGPGHRRDNEDLLEASGLDALLRDMGATYVDLNQDEVRAVPLRSRYTGLGSLYLPRTVLEADLIVSMPKMKTHHWAGVTLSLKNLFGIVPGCVYGWPKNRLHWEGIDRSILDVNAALPVPRLNLVDGIVGMEGNGPIQGDPRRSGVIVLGEDPVAVDATCARLMRIDPARVPYLGEAGAFLGNLDVDRIEQRGERIEPFRQDYRVMEGFRMLKEVEVTGS